MAIMGYKWSMNSEIGVRIGGLCTLLNVQGETVR